MTGIDKRVWILVLLAVFATLVVAVPIALAQSAGAEMPWSDASGLGGGASESNNFQLTGSVQHAAGESSSANYGVSSGFWPGVQALQSQIVLETDSDTVSPGGQTTVSTAPTTSGDVGVTNTFTNNTGGSGDATVTAATYTGNPTNTGIFDVGGGFVDVQVLGADASDLLISSFYYPDTIAGQTEADLVLFYDGSQWASVVSSGHTAPANNTSNDLGGTVSGGRFEVTFDDSITPKITELTGTVMAMTLTPLTCGDMNGNGLTEILDAITMMQIVVGTETPTQQQLAAGDIDPNGTVDVLDIIILMQHLVGRIPVIPCGP